MVAISGPLVPIRFERFVIFGMDYHILIVEYEQSTGKTNKKGFLVDELR